MKAIVPIGVIVLVAFGIFAVLSVMQREATNKLIQDDASGFFQEKRQEAEIARNGDSAPLFQRTVVSGPSWLDPLQNAIEDCWVAIKRLSTSFGNRVRPHKQTPARLVPPTAFPEGRFVTLLSPVSVQTTSKKTITLSAGSHFALLAVENDQAVIRYYNGRKYSIPLLSTDFGYAPTPSAREVLANHR
jgi:hypothetical protein